MGEFMKRYDYNVRVLRNAVRVLRREYINTTENLRAIGRLYPNGNAKEFFDGYKTGILKAIELIYVSNGMKVPMELRP
jgi:hypothetical protein